MTDTDIIEALERCIKCNARQTLNCDGCLLEGYYPYCDDKLEVMCLKLIKRQKAEIERLNAEITSYDIALKFDAEHYRADIERQKAEIDKLYKENLELKDGYFQKRYEETEHLELMGLREAYRRVDKERDFFQLKAMNLEEEKNDLLKKFAERVKKAMRTGALMRDKENCTIIDNLVKDFMGDNYK